MNLEYPAPETVISRLLSFAGSQPDAPAVIDRGKGYSYAVLAQGVQAAAAWLHHTGVRSGDIVALSLDLAPENSARSPNVYVDYGANEASPLATLRPEDWLEPPGTVGKINPGIEAQAVDDEGRILPPGTSGQLRFRAPWFPQGYVHNETASNQRFRDGWFYPGDLGAIDARGYVTLRGRADDVINFSGTKIAPSDIEAVLLQHPDVVDAAVVGVPDAMSGELPVAFVVLRRDKSASDLGEFCAGQIDGARLPPRHVCVAAIPRNPGGKIQRDRLCELYLGRVAKTDGSRSNGN
jgi:acyl-CoA synthetase (AMP-forming)/AMP-acid ligase II